MINFNYKLKSIIQLKSFRFEHNNVKMKFLLVLTVAVIAVSAKPADSHIDWTNVVPIRDLLLKGAPTPIKFEDSSVQRDRRIVNGQTADPHQFPYQVKLKSTIN